jgi:hypothetical protein
MSKIEASILEVGDNSIRLSTCRKGIAIDDASRAAHKNKHEAFLPDLLWKPPRSEHRVSVSSNHLDFLPPV